MSKELWFDVEALIIWSQTGIFQQCTQIARKRSFFPCGHVYITRLPLAGEILHRKCWVHSFSMEGGRNTPMWMWACASLRTSSKLFQIQNNVTLTSSEDWGGSPWAFPWIAFSPNSVLRSAVNIIVCMSLTLNACIKDEVWLWFDAFELWCWRRHLRVPWTVRRSNQAILKEISPKYSLDGLMLKLKLQYFGHLMWITDSLGKTLMLGKIEGRRRRKKRGWVGWMTSLTGWTWVWASSRSWWWTRKPSVLQSMGSQRVGHNWATDLNWTKPTL